MSDTDSGSVSHNIKLFFRSFLGIYDDSEVLKKARIVWHRRTSGALLLFIYGLVFYVVMMSLTAYQIQTRVHALGNGEEKITIWNVTRNANKYFWLQKRIDNQTLTNITLEKSLASAVEDENSATKNIQTTRDLLLLELLKSNPDLDIPKETGFEDLVSLVRNQKSSNPSSAVEKHLFDLRAANSKSMNLKSDREALEKLISSSNDKIETLREDLDTEISGNANFNKIIELTDELRFFYYPTDSSKKSWIGNIYTKFFGEPSATETNQVSYSFVTLPSEVLIILIVIAMGTMGSLISITQIFFSGEEKTITFYLFRPLLGAVVAIAVYVITKAGVLVSSNVGGGEIAVLNAFFISFISLIAGLMSENAINSIEKSGVRFLRGDSVTAKSRYANGVADAIEGSNKTKEELYPYFQYSPQEIDSWLEEKELVPADAQRVIAAWLDQPVRNLFSDMRPHSDYDQ